MIAIPLGNSRMRLHGIVVLNWRGINSINGDFGLAQSCFHVAETYISGNSGMTSRIRSREARFEVQLGIRRCVLPTNRRSRMMRLLQRLRYDHRDWLILIVDLIIL